MHGTPEFFALFARGSAFAFSAPVISDRSVAPKFRIAGIALIAMACSSLHGPLALDDLPQALLVETAVGLVAGFSARLVVSAADIGGELIGLGAGLGFAGSYDSAAGGMALPTRRLFAVMVGLCFIATGGIEVIVHLLALPRADGSVLVGGLLGLLPEAGRAIELGVRFAAPVIVATTVINAAMGLASRAAPALNVFSVTLAATVAATMAVLIATGSRITADLTGLGRHAVNVALEAVAP